MNSALQTFLKPNFIGLGVCVQYYLWKPQMQLRDHVFLTVWRKAPLTEQLWIYISNFCAFCSNRNLMCNLREDIRIE